MNSVAKSAVRKKGKSISANKWGYIFMIPFFVAFCVFQLYPLLSTFYNSFFENYRSGLNTIGPNFIGFDNYVSLFSVTSSLSLANLFGNTMIMWLMGFIPQLIFSLLFAYWFTNIRLKLKCQGIFKSIIYMPNLIMASAFSMLFFALFSDNGPINMLLMDMGALSEPYQFIYTEAGVRGLVALMNFLMWFGNTTILLMAAMMGIDVSLIEASEIDGASSGQIFRKITMPLIRPILVYVMITSLIGGLQMFDVPQILTNGKGAPNNTSMTLIMYLNSHLYSKNYGMAGAISVVLFIICAVLSFVVYYFFTDNSKNKRELKRMKKEADNG